MKQFRFYGVDNNWYKLDDTVWEAEEDESDGYRSYLQSIQLVENPQEEKLIFPDVPLAFVQVHEVDNAQRNDNFKGWALVDIKDNWVWLKVGTDYSDSYYPHFVFEYHPKPPPLTWETFIKE